jgi:hypothetical protein
MKRPSRLSDSLQRHLNAYALAASAAGVGMLASAHSAEGKVIYTPAHRWLPLNHRVEIDLNHDGIPDFSVRRTSGVSTSTYGQRFSTTGIGATAPRNNGIIGYPVGSGNSDWIAVALHSEYRIGSRREFRSGRAGMAGRVRGVGTGLWSCGGPWNNVKNRYLGLKFGINGKLHFGWARLNESCSRNGKRGDALRALLTGYAYETIPNKPIITGKTKGPDVITVEPGSLGALAAGASKPRSK